MSGGVTSGSVTRRVLQAFIVLAGAGMVAVPLLRPSTAAGALAIAGAVLVAASVTPPLRRWRGTGTLAAITAVAACALGHPAAPVLAAEGLLIFGYLLLLDGPHGAPLTAPALGRWLRQQAGAAAWGVATTAAVLVTLAFRVPVSAWLVVTGSAAAVAATLLALPRRGR